jgi:DNA repair exonuclease SbcCD ATPase subunit
MRKVNSVVLLAVACAIVFASGCAKPPADGNSAAGQSNKNAAQANANVQDLSATPLYQKTVRGDIERAGLAISMAHDLVKQENWNDALVQLRAARKQADDAVAQKPRLIEQFEALRSGIDRAIQLAENRDKGVEAQFSELQTRIGAVKAYIDQ